MKLVDILSEKTVRTNIEAAERDAALQEMLAQMAAAGMLDTHDVGAILEALVKREALGSTAIGRGVAVPHARTDAVEGTILGVGLSAAGVAFNSLDGEPVHAVFLVIGGSAAADDYLQVMQQVSELIQNEDFRRFLSHARTTGDVLDLVEEMS